LKKHDAPTYLLFNLFLLFFSPIRKPILNPSKKGESNSCLSFLSPSKSIKKNIGEQPILIPQSTHASHSSVIEIHKKKKGEQLILISQSIKIHQKYRSTTLEAEREVTEREVEGK